MKTKHYYHFENGFEILNDSNWDMLRTDETETPFSIEKTQEKYEENCNKEIIYKRHAEILNDIIETNLITDKRLFSMGCGKAVLEYHLKKIKPDSYLICSDYTKYAIERLKRVFLECNELLTFDMLNKDDYLKIMPEDIVIMYRVSTEFSVENWKLVFDNLFNRNIKNIVFIPTGILTLKELVQEKINYLCRAVKLKKNTFCGWLYDEKAFSSFWENKYIIRESRYVENNCFYYLERIDYS